MCLLMAGYAQTITYTVSNTGSWDDAANWNQITAPVNDPKAKTITLSNSAIVGYLALDDGDVGTRSARVDGGSLRSESDGNGAWNAIGYDSSSSILFKNGGSLFLPESFYKVSGNLTIPAGVTLRGDWKEPVPGQSIIGKV